MLGNAYKDYRQERIIWNIYNELPKHVYMAEVYLDCEFIEYKDIATGVVVEGHFIFPAHCAVYENTNDAYFITTILGPGKLIKREIKLRGYLLEEIYFNEEEDIAVYKLPEELYIPDFPCAVKKEVHLGEKAFIIGNPLLAGLNIRRGNVSSIISLKVKRITYLTNTFSIDTTGYPGDSGCPVISADYKLVGIAVVSFGPDVLCVKHIKKFTEHIK